MVINTFIYPNIITFISYSFYHMCIHCIYLSIRRDVINVISFSLKTAEQSLLEDHPDLHTKLVSGRVKSLKNLQVSATEKQKNIDFRSIEMCSLSSSHLEEFQTKAQQGVSTATEEFLSLMENFRNHLCYVVSD